MNITSLGLFLQLGLTDGTIERLLLAERATDNRGVVSPGGGFLCCLFPTHVMKMGIRFDVPN